MFTSLDNFFDVQSFHLAQMKSIKVQGTIITKIPYPDFIKMVGHLILHLNYNVINVII